MNLFAKTVGLISSYMLNSKTEFDYLIIGQKASALDVGFTLCMGECDPQRVGGGSSLGVGEVAVLRVGEDFNLVLAEGVALKVCRDDSPGVGEGVRLRVGIIEQSRFRRYNNGMMEYSNNRSNS